MKNAMIISVFTLLAVAIIRGDALNYFTSAEWQAKATFVDAPLLKQYKEKNIQPALSCSDCVFVRRVYLDLTGNIPAEKQARDFIEDKSSDKRTRLIEELLASEGFSDYCAMLWCDRLRVKSEFPINLWPNAVQAYHRWVLASIRENKPYNEFVREILVSNGSNFRAPPVNFFRAVKSNDPVTVAEAVALTFMGCRINRWSEDKKENMAAFFSDLRFNKTGEWKEEIVYVDLFSQSADRWSEKLILPNGASVTIPLHMDARKVFADWLTAPENPLFAKNAVNSIWYQLFGYGIIHEPDDICSGNPPVNKDLIVLLEKELIKSGYDLRHIYRIILNSATYQRSCVPVTKTAEAERLFASYPLRRVDAETLIDALCQITNTREEYWSVIPEPYTIIPSEQPAVTLADGSISSSFLELFGRPPRDTGLASERNNEVTAAQMLHLLNSSHIRNKIAGKSNKKNRLVDRWRERRRSLNRYADNFVDLYYRVLSRPPSEKELAVISDYKESAVAKGREADMDIVWALINSPEFIFKH